MYEILLFIAVFFIAAKKAPVVYTTASTTAITPVTTGKVTLLAPLY